MQNREFFHFSLFHFSLSVQNLTPCINRSKLHPALAGSDFSLLLPRRPSERRDGSPFISPLSRLCILEIMIFNVLVAPSVRKNSKLFGFSLTYSYLWLMPNVLSFGKTQNYLVFLSLTRTFAHKFENRRELWHNKKMYSRR